MILSLKPIHDWLDRLANAALEKERKEYSWHFWFAWKPRIIFANNEVCIAWFSTIARKRSCYDKPKWMYGPVTNVVTQPQQ